MRKTVDIVFDGPPGPNSQGHHCNFVEVEHVVPVVIDKETGEWTPTAGNYPSIHVGEWIDRGNGFWALRLEAWIDD